MTHTIHCADCGHPRQTSRKNTKYCTVCRLFRDLAFLQTGGFKIRPCAVCDTKFAPLNRNDALCAKCDIPKESAVIGDCAFCETEQRLHSDAVGICTGCLKEPKHAPKIFKAVGRKRLERTQAVPA
jgi:hypothetical protein